MKAYVYIVTRADHGGADHTIVRCFSSQAKADTYIATLTDPTILHAYPTWMYSVEIHEVE